MYEKLEPLSSVQHADLNYREVADYGFARAVQSAPLVLSEFVEAQKNYPIVFMPNEKEGPIPVALFGVQSGENLFVGADGRWEANYIPAFIRRYPFMVAEPQHGTLQLLIDKAYPGFGAAGTPLFDNQAESELLKRKLDFVRHYHRDALATKAFVARIQALDLFVPMTLKLQIPGRDGQISLGGFLVIDEARLKALAADQVSALFAAGDLAAIHAHQMSLSSTGRLIDAAVRKSRSIH